MYEESDGKFHLSRNLLSRPSNTVELSHELVLTNFKYKEPEFYARLFDESEEIPFEVTPGRTNVGIIRKPVPGTPKLYVLQDSKSACVLCSF